jgi:hypothetical protein
VSAADLISRGSDGKMRPIARVLWPPAMRRWSALRTRTRKNGCANHTLAQGHLTARMQIEENFGVLITVYDGRRVARPQESCALEAREVWPAPGRVKLFQQKNFV